MKLTFFSHIKTAEYFADFETVEKIAKVTTKAS
jgi:hypothetical protein